MEEEFTTASTRALELEIDGLMAAGLRAVRESKGLTIGQLAEASGIPKAELRHHEDGKLPISVPRLITLAIALL